MPSLLDIALRLERAATQVEAASKRLDSIDERFDRLDARVVRVERFMWGFLAVLTVGGGLLGLK